MNSLPLPRPSLLAYLSGRAQVPMLARGDTVTFFSSFGPDLNYWQRARGVIANHT